MNAAKQTGAVTIYVSHGAGSGSYPDPSNATVDWFIVEPRDDPERLAAQVESLRDGGRTVIALEVTPYSPDLPAQRDPNAVLAAWRALGRRGVPWR